LGKNETGEDVDWTSKGHGVGSKKAVGTVCLFPRFMPCLFFCFNGTGHSSEENPPDFGNEKLDERAAQKGKNYGPQADWAFQGECHKQGEYLPNCFGNHEAQPEALMEHIHELIDRSDGKLGLDVGGNTDGRKKQADPKN
jgi:hypothetical protein